MVAQIDLTGISYFLPLLSFLVIFIIIFALLKKVNIFENVWVQLFVSFIMATVFVTFAGARAYVTNLVPWFVVLFLCLFFILLIVGFIGKDMDFVKKPIGIGFVVILIIVFIVSAIFVFSSSITPYLPQGSSYGQGANSDVLQFTDWIYSSRVAGGILLIIVSALVSWVLVSAKGK